MPAYAMAVRRGCGTRRMGGIYAECGIALPDEDGERLEHFIVDPPLPIEPSKIGLAPVGIKMIERDDVWHLWDWVGENYYPNVADFLEEVRLFGLSRGPIPKSLDFSKLTNESMIILVHRRAWLGEREPYYQEWRATTSAGQPWCPKGAEEHFGDHETKIVPEPMCAGVWWQDIDPDDGEITRGENMNPRDITRVMPSFQYNAALRPGRIEMGDHVPAYSPAIFASFPIGRLAVVNDPEGQQHVDAFGAASKAGVPTDLVED